MPRIRISAYGDIAEKVRRQCRRFVVHDVWVPRRGDSSNSFCSRIRQDLFEFGRCRGFACVWLHRIRGSDNQTTFHAHAVHDCSYSNSTCRCRGWRQLARRYLKRSSFGKFTRRIYRTESIITNEWLNNISEYSSIQGRQHLFVEIGRQYLVPFDNSQDNAIRGGGSFGEEGEVEFGFEGCRGRFEPGDTYERDTTSQSFPSEGAPFFCAVRGVPPIVQWLSQNIVVPDHNITLTEAWLKGPYRFITERDTKFKTATKIHRSILSIKNLEQLKDVIDKADSVTFYPTSTNPLLDIDTSEHYLLQFLQLQMPFGYKIFLKDLYSFLNKTSGKHNCILIKGPPNVGKTWFANIVSKLMLNTGFIRNTNRYSRFPLQDCVRRNLLIFDEPNVEASSLEMFKLLLGGTPADIKFKNQNLINRTPVLVTCNRDPFPVNAEFTSRITRYEWDSSSVRLIDSIIGDIHPLGLYVLMHKYAL
ncbi:hypothetical protein AAG570_003940 [Ranatra chinensis]|uniref:SF3 helicase domain-containing protein n=1 Tax=Ranatra chinensis TaxID=642074 RepID=A0ABD0Y4M6_9HEMI